MTNAHSFAARPRFGMSRHLQDPCLEVGPGISPFPVPPGVRQILAEREFEGSLTELFPELGPDARAPKGDVYLDLDIDGLRQFAPASLGSVVVSHVLEHTANPVKALREIHRTLRDGGTALIALPDRRYTFDRDRQGTTVGHLMTEYEQCVSTVSDAHIIEFCKNVEKRSDSEVTAELIELHRKRSIHVHCWTAEEFFALILWLTNTQIVQFDLVDFMGIEQSIDGSADEEFIMVLRKVPSTSATRLAFQWGEFIASNLVVHRERIQHLATVLCAADSMFSESVDRSHPHFQDVSLNQIVASWLQHRDLRVHEFPLIDPSPMIDWAVLERETDTRAATCWSPVGSAV